MSNATVSRLGLVDNTGTDFDALFLKVFSGEVLTAFTLPLLPIIRLEIY